MSDTLRTDDNKWKGHCGDLDWLEVVTVDVARQLERELTAVKAECERLRELHKAAEDLIQIVEGFRGERWTANGKRLVDTPEWCRFYVASMSSWRPVREAIDAATKGTP